MNTSLDLELMSVVLRFWSNRVKSFLFLVGPISLTLRDVSILTGFPIQGIDALSLLDTHHPSLPSMKVSSTTQTSYSTTIRKWDGVSEIPNIVEHVEFLWFFCVKMYFFSYLYQTSHGISSLSEIIGPWLALCTRHHVVGLSLPNHKQICD